MNLIHKDRTDEKSVFKQLRDVVLNLTQCADDFLPLLTAVGYNFLVVIRWGVFLSIDFLRLEQFLTVFEPVSRRSNENPSL